jgi:signal transduction histidine kinase
MMQNGRSERDLRLQLLALYLLFVIPIFALTIFFYYNAGQRLRGDVAAADLSLARAIALETDAMLLKAKDAVEAFAKAPAVIQADPAGMESAFTAGAAARQDINLFYRLSGQGIMLYHYPTSPRSTVGQDFSFRDYFQIARATGQHVFSKGRISPTTGRPVVTSVMPVFVQGRFDGVVATNLELQRLSETIARISLQLPDSKGIKIIIVDATGQVIAHSEPDHLLQNVADTLPGVTKVLLGQEGSLTVPDADQTEWLYTYTPVPNANWGVIVQRSGQLAFASLDLLQRGIIISLVLFGLGALFFWVVLSNRVINPLEKLTRYGAGVDRETLAAELDRELILPISQRPDQIGRLTRALLRAEHHIRLRLMELTTLNKTGAAVVATLDSQQVIDNILNEVQRLLAVHQCALLVVNEDTQQLELRASRGLSRNYPTKVDLTDACQRLPACRAIITGRPIQVPDIETEPNFAPMVAVARTEGYRSVLAIPLNAPHTPRAALAIYRADIHHFSEQEIDLVASFANFAAIALEHATLFSLTDAELQQRVRFLSALNRVGRTVSQSLMIDDVLSNAMEAVFEVMPADACWIYLQRETEDFLRLRAQRGFPDSVLEQVRQQRVEYGQGIIGKVAQGGRPLLLEGRELQGDEWQREPIIAEGDWQAVAVAPLLAKETIIGVVGMATRTDQTFTAAEVELLEAIGDQIAIAVVNARLYRRSREVATLEERNRVAREIHDTLAQGFTGILVQLQAAERLSLKHPEKAVQSLQEARDLARQSLQEARRSVFNLRPTALEHHTLDRVLAHDVQRFEKESGIRAEFVLEGYPSLLHPDVEQNLYRITQEALTNIRRHAQANRVNVTLSFEPGIVALSIIDDGIGLNGRGSGSEPVISGRTRNGQDGRTGRLADLSTGGFGLVGIRERVHLMNGKIAIESPSTGGTRIKVVIPK